jgi:hypothetical protein
MITVSTSKHVVDKDKNKVNGMMIEIVIFLCENTQKLASI